MGVKPNTNDMGLDMYLSKRTYVKQWEHTPAEEQFEVTVKRGGQPYEGIQSNRISYVTESIMYWRKANQIHGFFVNNCQEIEQDVKYDVTTADLMTLRDLCVQVLEVLNKSEKKVVQVRSGWSGGEEVYSDVETYDCEDEISDLLPPSQGFFFGSYEIDDYYKQDVQETLDFLEKELPNCGEYDEFEYYASW